MEPAHTVQEEGACPDLTTARRVSVSSILDFYFLCQEPWSRLPWAPGGSRAVSRARELASSQDPDLWTACFETAQGQELRVWENEEWHIHFPCSGVLCQQTPSCPL